MSDSDNTQSKIKFDLNTPDGRKKALHRIIEDYGSGKATASDAKGALQILMKLEGDISDNVKDELRADPYSVMKVFLRAEGLTAIESLRTKMHDDAIAEGIAKVLGAVKVGIKWKDGCLGRFVDSSRPEPKQDDGGAVNEAQRVVGGEDAGPAQAEAGRNVDEPEQEKGEPT